MTLTDAELEALTGVDCDIFHRVRTVTSGTEQDVLITLFIAKHGVGYDVASVVYNHLLGGGAISPQNLGYRVRKVLQECLVIPFPKPTNRFDETLEHCPRVTCLVDTFPVRMRGPHAFYNGKYGCKVIKMQLTTTVRGQPLAMEECETSTINDGKEAKVNGIGFPLLPWELVLGDKAYVSVPHMLPPVKHTKKGQAFSEEVALFNKYHQLCRSPAERVNARLHAFACLECRRFSRTTTRRFVRLVCIIDSMKVPPATDYIVVRDAYPDGVQSSIKDETKRLGIILRQNAGSIKWHGKASANRKQGHPGRKPLDLVFEATCAKCGMQKRLCGCPAPRPRGRPRKVQVQVNEEEGVNEESSDSISSSSEDSSSESTSSDSSSSSD